MSRGPGKWQSLILCALEQHPGFYVRDLLPPNANRAQRSALWRATRILEAQGSIAVTRWVARTVGNGGVSVMRPGTDMSREQLRAVNVAKGSN